MLLKNKPFAVFVAAVLILLAFIAGAVKAVFTNAGKVESAFYASGGIQADLDEIYAQSANLYAVASRYYEAGDALLVSLKSASDALRDADKIPDKKERYLALYDKFSALYLDLKENSKLSDRDKTLIAIYYGDFQSRMTTIGLNESYNAAALKFNKMCGRLPLSLVCRLFGVGKAATF